MASVLVAGGLGYLGSIITDLLSKSGKFDKVEVYDILLWENGSVVGDISCHKVHNSLPHEASVYDIIVWCATPDCFEFYQPQFNPYLEKSLKDFEYLLKHSDRFFYLSTFIQDYPQIKDEHFREYMNRLEILCGMNLKSRVKVPSLYGPSPRMRWDTIVNEIIFELLVRKTVFLEDDWLIDYPIMNVADYANHFVNNIIFGLRQPIYDTVCTDILNTVEITSILTAGKEDLNFKIINRSDRFSYLCDSVKNKTTINILDSYDNILKGLEKNVLPDFEKDKYNNRAVLANVSSALDFIKRTGL